MAPLEIDRLLETALRCHDAGQLARAEALYRHILAHQPDRDEAIHLLGVLALQVQRPDLAVEHLRRAAAIRPNIPAYHGNLGNAFRGLGRLDEAIACYRRTLELAPESAEAHNNLGEALYSQGRADEAVACYRRALRRKPDYAEAHYNLGLALAGQRSLDEAVACYRRALRWKPDYADAHNNLGIALAGQGNLDEAVACYRRALERTPDNADAHNNLGIALTEQGKLDEAVASYRRALERKPAHAEAHNNLGSALKDQGKLDEAAACCRRALELKPDFAEAHNNFGNVLRDRGQLDEAAACYRRALQRKPDFAQAHGNLGIALREQGMLDDAEAHFDEAIRLQPLFDEAHCNRAMLLMLRGDFVRGWAEFEWRWKTEKLSARPRSFAKPQWDGGPLEGRTILLHCEQGFGDTFQFIRYAPVVARSGGNVIVECQPQVKRLLRGSLGQIQVFDYREPLPAFDVQCPLLSLPMTCRTTLATIPRQVPYVHVDADALARWRNEFAGTENSLKVGLVWAGNQEQKDDRNRSMTLQDLVPLGRVPGVAFYSLQKGEPALQAVQPPAGMRLIDWSNELADFADTAALMAHLDLIISVDTSVSHLAGAMGRPVWTLLRFGGDWRYLLEPEDVLWYPTMRLFRQPAAGDWRSVVHRVADALAEVAAHPKGR